MTDIVKSMCRAYYDEGSDSGEAAMRSALLWLSEHVTDEMVAAWRHSMDTFPPNEWLPAIGQAKALAAAIRAAAGEEGK